MSVQLYIDKKYVNKAIHR